MGWDNLYVELLESHMVKELKVYLLGCFLCFIVL